MFEISQDDKHWFDDERCKTKTSKDQSECEKECYNFLRSFQCYDSTTLNRLLRNGLISDSQDICILREKHASYLMSYLFSLPGGFVTLDASRPWLVYWIVHALYLLGPEFEPVHLYAQICLSLLNMQNSYGGFGGGPSQISQGAPNYAAVLSLCIASTAKGSDISILSRIDRKAMYNYFMSLKQKNGGFLIHKVDGEVDSRGVYTVLSVARLLNILTPELYNGTAEYLLRCQTYEGGFGSEPGTEAHGGYNFCALAGLLILESADRCNVSALEHWLLMRQTSLEGGFQGRTNKLVDSCYSFWQGAAMAIVEVIKRGGNDIYDLRNYKARTEDADKNHALMQRLIQATETNGVQGFNQLALQKYILNCAQNIETGGLRDKPGKSRDFYHTCYALSGLSVAQNSFISEDLRRATDTSIDRFLPSDVDDILPRIDNFCEGPVIFGDSSNILPPTSIVYNIGLDRLDKVLQFFGEFHCSHQLLCN